MLSPDVIDQFDHRTYSQGIDYCCEGRVEITDQESGPGGFVSATVFDEDENEYDVWISWGFGGVSWDCSCRCQKKNTSCKHAVATLLTAADQGLLDSRFLNTPGQKEAIAVPAPKKPDIAEWTRHLDKLRSDAQVGVADGGGSSAGKALPAGSQILYVLQPPSWAGGSSAIRPMRRSPKLDGTLDRPKKLELSIDQLCKIPEADRAILASIVGLGSDSFRPGERLPETYPLSQSVIGQLLPQLSRTGRLYWSDTTTQPDECEMRRIVWQDQPFDVELELAGENGNVILRCIMVQDDRRWESHSGLVHAVEQIVLIEGSVGAFRNAHAAWWFTHFRQLPEISCPACDLWKLVDRLAPMGNLPPLRVSGEIPFTVVCPEPSVAVRLQPVQTLGNRNRLTAETLFYYESHFMPAGRASSLITDEASNRILQRNYEAESKAMAFLESLDFKRDAHIRQLVIPEKKALSAIVAMTQRGWTVEAEKIGRCRPAGALSIGLSSNIDWFDVRGEARFDDQIVSLPKLLEAIVKGERFVKLGDGSVGILPEQWFKQVGMLATAGRVEGDALRFKRPQVAILDLLLQQLPEAKWDSQFQLLRDQLHRFDGIQPAEPSASFVGTLRDYQKEGLGWFEFLRQFQFGGCLADDMGLGKTVQVLAMLDQRRLNKQGAARASLVVAPRSLVFNWMQEASRFAPELKVLDHSGPGRAAWIDQVAEFDLILTTYGTLRTDAAKLRDVVFDYVILDESQAIKNATTATAKAVRLLEGAHRLALSGTPIENHLGELWSLFEFLNPGMLGKASIFAGLAKSTEINAETARFLGKALRPFILRRTKEQVAKELPDRTEQTIYCELEGEHKKHYIELRDHYRKALLGGDNTVGLEKTHMQVLEALLRLRQAACHPGLLDERRTNESSPKLDAILDRIQSVTEEGHKVLVFSQFTTLLAIVRQHLDKLGIVYEYLDGQTRNRQERVERFQNDPACPLFLISLKAGGVGLNLTAADYVFILDPWWNPAVEAQAIDRAHRIGQQRQVFAYRLITKGTVEEKVLELQARKRELADAIINNASSGPLASLTRDDLEMLLQ